MFKLYHSIKSNMMQSEKWEATKFYSRGRIRLWKCWNSNYQKSRKMLSLLFIAYCLWNGAEQNKYQLWTNSIFFNLHFVPLERTFMLKYWNLICYTFHWVWWAEFDFEKLVERKADMGAFCLNTTDKEICYHKNVTQLLAQQGFYNLTWEILWMEEQNKPKKGNKSFTIILSGVCSVLKAFHGDWQYAVCVTDCVIWQNSAN